MLRLLRVWCCGGVTSQILRLLWLIGVWKWFCSHRTGNARLLWPPCLRRTESHAENPTTKARSTYWRRAFAVPSTCVRRATGHVSVRPCACLYLSSTAPVRWRPAPLTCVARMDISSLARVYIARQATGLDAWASRVKCPARFVSHLYDICIWVVYSFCLVCCLFIIVTTQFVAWYKPCKPKPKPSTYDPLDNHPLAEIQRPMLRPEPQQQICHQHANTDHFGK